MSNQYHDADDCPDLKNHHLHIPKIEEVEKAEVVKEKEAKAPIGFQGKGLKTVQDHGDSFTISKRTFCKAFEISSKDLGLPVRLSALLMSMIIARLKLNFQATLEQMVRECEEGTYNHDSIED